MGKWLNGAQTLRAAMDAAGAQLDAAPYGLQIGDMRVNGAWTRNQDGEQITLDENATYDELVAHIAELEAILKGKEADTNAAEE